MPTASKERTAKPTLTPRESGFSIGDRAVFLSIHFSSFGNRRRVPEGKVETDAEKRMLNVTKRLLESEELQKISRLEHEVLAYVYSVCLPFDKGTHILPIEAIERLENYLRAQRMRFQDLIEQFIERYPELRRAAIEPLGSLYNAGDYPSTEGIREEFAMRWQYITFATPHKLAEISPALFAEEKAKAAEMMRETFEEIRAVLRMGMLELITRLRQSLEPGTDGKVKRLTSASVARLQEFLETFKFRNITDDAELGRLASQVRNIMAGIDSEQIRDSEQLRDRVRATMAEVGSKLETLTPTRKFRFGSGAAA
jgi:hypothetical protein